MSASTNTASAPHAEALTVQIWMDVICPFCPIGARRLESALEQFPARDEVEIVYRAYRLQPGVAPHSVDDYLTRKFGGQPPPTAIHRQVAQRAAQEGLIYHLEETLVGDTLDAHRLIRLASAAGQSRRLVQRLYRGYFTDGINLFEQQSLLRLAAEAGLDAREAADVLSSDRFTAEVEADQQEARRIGIRSIPHLVIGQDISVSGGEPAPDLLAALSRAWDTR